MQRRDVLKIAGATAIAVRVAHAAPRFFTPEEFAAVDELTETIIPSDEHSPGARAAGVAAYIDARLAESPDSADQWRDGLRPFLKLTARQRTKLLDKLSKDEQSFFHELKRRTVLAYYSSEIGIHREMNYKGNVPITQFAGYEVK